MRVAAMVAAGLCLSGAANAQAITEKQINVIENIAQVRVGKEFCPTVEINEAFVRGALAIYKINLDESPYKEEMARRMERIRSTINRGKGSHAAKSKIVCANLQELFGPNGKRVRNLVKASAT